MKILRFPILLITLLVMLVFPVLPNSINRVANAANNCASSSPTSGAYTATVCFTAPQNGATLSGAVPVTATISVTGSNPGVQRMVFYLNSVYLLTDYQSPYTFSLPTTRWVDGSYTIAVEALMRDSFITSRATQTELFSNGITTPPVNNNTFTPTSGRPAGGAPFVVMAAGDGASGETNETKVVNLIAGVNPNLFLYLGDVYEKGAPVEFYNWYGTSGSFYSQFRSITDPAIGNHEYSANKTAAGYFDYWNNIPNYYSFNAGGWHFISLNSNSSKIGVTSTSPQYAWLQQDLAANTGVCTIVYYHHPLFDIGPEGPTTAMADIWALMAQNHVAIVVNGHDHDYQRWFPLDGSGNLSANGITEFVAGGGGHGLQTISRTDSRVVYSNSKNPDALGSLKLSLSSSGAAFSYMSVNGSVLDSGTVPCSSSGGGDTQPPSTPTGLTATAASSTQVNLGWQASTDNVGVTGYTIYRNGAALNTVGGGTLSYTDSTVSASTSYTYTVDAFDAAGNHSTQSSPATVTTPGGSADTQPPSVPAGLSATAASSTQVNLGWQASTDNVGVTGYTIYRGGTVLTTVGGSVLSYQDKTVSASTSYTYTVDAFDAAGNHSTQSSPATVTTPSGTGTTSLTFTPAADTYVNSGSPTTNFGSATTLRADGSPDVHSYLRFTVQGVGTSSVVRARLRIFANSATSAGIAALQVADNTWVESTVNYNTAPALGSQIAASGAVTTGTWVELIVTAYITGDGTYNIGVITPGATAISMASRESGANAPQLIVDIQ